MNKSKKPIAHVVFIADKPHSVMLNPHSIEVDDVLWRSIPVYKIAQNDWFSISEIQFKTLAKHFGYVKREKK